MTVIGGKQVDMYPMQMVHPNARKAKSTAVQFIDPVSGRHGVDYKGEPDIFPPITVHNYDQEIAARRNGYLMRGEQPAAFKYEEWPMWLNHPDHVPAIEPLAAILDRDNRMVSPARPGRAAVWPPVLVKDEAEREAAEAKGYRVTGRPDPLAAESLVARIDRDWQPDQGFSGDGPDTTSSGLPKYPMWVHGELAVNAETEAAIRAKHGEATPDPKELARARRELLLRQLAEANAIIGEDVEAPGAAAEAPAEAPRRAKKGAAA